MDLERSFARFITDREVQQVSPRHLAQLKYRTRQFGEFLAARGITDTSQLNSEIVTDYLLTYIKPVNGRKYSSWYIRGIATIIRAYLRFLFTNRIIRDPIHFTMPRFHRPLPKIIEAEQMQQIIDSCQDPNDQLLLLFFFDTGLRLEEAVRLVWDDISLEKGTVLVRHGKGDKFRYVAMGKTLTRLLGRYRYLIERETGEEPLPLDPVFCTNRGTPYTTHGMYSRFVRLSERLGVHITAHMLRRGYAKTARLICKRDWEDIQQSMGHTSIDQTRAYVGFLSQDDVQKARQTSPVDHALRVPTFRKTRKR
ncbi:MAG: tyrosine-type recombinase/integrase [Chloroflexi bacterium]|nr:tyrosine-type recombinase/integrase [Chloroflexota bacterium]